MGAALISAAAVAAVVGLMLVTRQMRLSQLLQHEDRMGLEAESQKGRAHGHIANASHDSRMARSTNPHRTSKPGGTAVHIGRPGRAGVASDRGPKRQQDAGAPAGNLGSDAKPPQIFIGVFVSQTWSLGLGLSTHMRAVCLLPCFMSTHASEHARCPMHLPPAPSAASFQCVRHACLTPGLHTEHFRYPQRKGC